MSKVYGWTGKLLWIDLTTRKIRVVPTSDFKPVDFIGGVGLNTKIFWELGSPKVNAFHPDNPLLLAIGPLTGASGPFSRAEICGIAPQTYPDELFAYSGFGGKFPSELKYAGYDGIVVLGKADRPVYIQVDNGDAKIKNAGSLWGQDTFVTQRELMKQYPTSSVLAIGPAGENLSRIAVILNETASCSGQGGYGAVMGSKNLKAIVVHGTGSIKIAKPEKFLDLLIERQAAGEWTAGPHQTWGRSPLCGGIIRYTMSSTHLKKYSGCHGCPFQCQGFYSMPDIGAGGQMCVEAWYGWFSGGSPEGYWEGNILSQKLGVNNYELLGIMIFLSNAIRSGAVTKADLGLSFIPIIDNASKHQFGGQQAHHRFLTELVGGIANGSSPLSQGIARAVQQFGPKAKRIFEAQYPARGYTSHHIETIPAALHWATDSRDPFNSCHDYTSTFGRNSRVASYFGFKGGRMKVKDIYDGAENETAWVQHHQCVKNSLPMCEYTTMPDLYFHPPETDVRIFESSLLSAITGIDYSPDELWKAGERIWNLRRAIMVLREDRKREDDTLSHVWFKRLAGGSQHLAAPLEEDEWEALKDRYYELCGWNVSNGRPKRERLKKLGLGTVADRLEKAGKLG
jgi:aldehyde:ferredoxin oxidoreductase